MCVCHTVSVVGTCMCVFVYVWGYLYMCGYMCHRVSGSACEEGGWVVRVSVVGICFGIFAVCVGNIFVYMCVGTKFSGWSPCVEGG